MATKTRNQSTTSSRKKVSPGTTPTTVPATAASSNGSSPSSSETMRHLYTSLLRCRLAQERARQSKTGNYEVGIGDEAIIVGPTAELKPEDTIASTGQNLAALVARGLPLAALITGQATNGASHGAMLPLSVPADPFNLATGIALAHKLAKKQNVVVAFCPAESPALKSWNEALKFAGEHKLPVLFIIKNGVADQRSSNEHAPHLEAFSFMTRDYGYPGIIVDGQDVVAVWRAAHESIHRARNGSGPTLIDCRTDSRRDPLAHLEHYMRKRNLWDDSWRKQAEARIKAELGKASTARAAR
jgi:TPP-dependent pyruvate/acetoin dehydrogenase alpha subunit